MLGYQEGGKFIDLGNVQRESIPQTATEFVIVMTERATDKVLANGPASVEPAIGLFPVEKKYYQKAGELRSEVHLGHPITRIYEKPSELAADIVKAAQKIEPPVKPSFGR